MIILTHPCAGKTYWKKKKPDIVGDPTTNDRRFPMKYNFVCVGHKAKDYDAAIALDDDMMETHVRKRKKSGEIKAYKSLDKVKACRDQVLRIAKKRKLPTYRSIPEFLKAHGESI